MSLQNVIVMIVFAVLGVGVLSVSLSVEDEDTRIAQANASIKCSGWATPKKNGVSQWLLVADCVEKLCFEKCDDFICDLSGIAYCRYEVVAEVATNVVY